MLHNTRVVERKLNKIIVTIASPRRVGCAHEFSLLVVRRFERKADSKGVESIGLSVQ